jgi:hypothetical protein
MTLAASARAVPQSHRAEAVCHATDRHDSPLLSATTSHEQSLGIWRSLPSSGPTRLALSLWRPNATSPSRSACWQRASRGSEARRPRASPLSPTRPRADRSCFGRGRGRWRSPSSNSQRPRRSSGFVNPGSELVDAERSPDAPLRMAGRVFALEARLLPRQIADGPSRGRRRSDSGRQHHVGNVSLESGMSWRRADRGEW